MLHETRLFAPSPELVKQANVSGLEACRDLCAEAERVRIYIPLKTVVDEAFAMEGYATVRRVRSAGLQE